MTCSCHSGPLYASLVRCPRCGHKSFDEYPGLGGSCERRKCGFEVNPEDIMVAQLELREALELDAEEREAQERRDGVERPEV